jgi:hypothetical protein
MVLNLMITYAATGWWPRVKLKASRVELSKLQTMACLGITGGKKTTLTAATVLLRHPPLHPKLEAGAQRNRCCCTGLWKPKSQGYSMGMPNPSCRWRLTKWYQEMYITSLPWSNFLKKVNENTGLKLFFLIWFVRLLALRPLLAYCVSLG